MPKVMKPPTDWDEDDTDTGGNFYDGPLPQPGLYKGKVVKLFLTKVSDGEKKGELRFMVVCEITEGKYKGAGVTKWLQMTPQGRPWLHQFLHSLTDGSEEQKAAIRKQFKNIGWTAGDPDQKKRLPITKIGKSLVIQDRPCNFVTKLRPGNDDVTRAEIARFVTPFSVDEDEDEDDTSPEDALDGADVDDDDPTAQFLPEGDDSDEGTADESETDAAEADSDAADDSVSDDPADDDSGDDDPWSV